jgi:hypothetical protein
MMSSLPFTPQHMLPPIMNVSPPNILRSLTSMTIKLLDAFTGADPDVHAVDALWTLHEQIVAYPENATTP